MTKKEIYDNKIEPLTAMLKEACDNADVPFLFVCQTDDRNNPTSVDLVVSCTLPRGSAPSIFHAADLCLAPHYYVDTPHEEDQCDESATVDAGLKDEAGQ